MNSIEGLANFTEDTQNNAIVDNAVFTDSAINGPQGVVGFATLQDNAVNEGTLDVAVFNNTATNAAGGVVVTEATFSDGAACIGVVEGNAIFRDTSELHGTVLGNATLLGDVTVGADAIIEGIAIVATTVNVSPDATFDNEPITHVAPTFTPYPSSSVVYLITGYNDIFYANANGTGSADFTYTWYKDDIVLQNVSTSSLQITALGTYKVTVANTYSETLESSAVSVSGLGGRTTITLQPQGSSLHAIQYVLSANSTGTEPKDTIWYNNIGQSLTASNTLIVEGVSGEYTYVASTLYETVSSNTVSVALTSLNGDYSVKLNNSYLHKTATSNHLLSADDFTIEAWVKPAVSGTYNPLIEVVSTTNGVLGGAGATTGWRVATDTNGYVYFNFSGTSINYLSDFIVTNQKLTANEWQHIAITKSNNNIRIFYNGTLISETTHTTAIAQLINQNVKIKCGIVSTTIPLTYVGRIAGLRLIKGQAIYTSNFVVPYSKLTTTGYGDVNQNITGTVLELDLQSISLSGDWTKSVNTVISPDSNWFLDDVAQLTDLTGTGNGTQGRSGLNYVDGVLTVHENNVNAYYPYNKLWYSGNNLTTSTALYTGRSVTTLTTSGDFIVGDQHYNVNSSGLVTTFTSATATGTFSKVFGTDNYINAQMSDVIGTSNFTVEAFVRLNTVSITQGILDIYSNSIRHFTLIFSSVNYIRLYVNGISPLVTPTLNVNQWYHIAVVRSNTTLSMYLNGVLCGPATQEVGYIPHQNVRIGHNASSNYFWGDKITNVRVSKVARYSGESFNHALIKPFIKDSDTLLLALQTNSLESNLTPVGNITSSSSSPWQ